MTTRFVTVRCEHGLHLRVASQVAKIAQAAKAAVHISCTDCEHADACSVLQLLALGAAPGTQLELVAEGPEEAFVLNALTEVFEQGAGI